MNRRQLLASLVPAAVVPSLALGSSGNPILDEPLKDMPKGVSLNAAHTLKWMAQHPLQLWTRFECNGLWYRIDAIKVANRLAVEKEYSWLPADVFNDPERELKDNIKVNTPQGPYDFNENVNELVDYLKNQVPAGHVEFYPTNDGRIGIRHDLSWLNI